MAGNLQAWREDLLKRLRELCSHDGRVPRLIAEELVARSAWWEGHPAGPVRAPRHAERIDGDERSWFVEFGANSFLVAAAVRDCCQRIRQWVREQQALPVSAKSWERLAGELHVIVRGSIANYRGDTYSGYGRGAQGKLVFGTQAVYVNDFVSGLAAYLKTPELQAFQGRAAGMAAPREKRRAKAPSKPGRAICPQCQCEVSASKLDSHIKKRCPKRTTVQIFAAKAKQRSKQIVKPIPPLQLGPGMVICPRCKGVVRAENLKKHLGYVCQNRKKRSVSVLPVAKEATTSDKHQLQSPHGDDEAVCPWCGARMKKLRLARHQAKRCPKRPQSTSNTK